MSPLNCSVSSPAGVWNCMVPSGAFLSGVEKATMMTSHWGETSRSGKGDPAAPYPAQEPMSRWPLGEPLIGTAATVALGGADGPPPAPGRPPRAGHGLEGSVSACASVKL